MKTKDVNRVKRSALTANQVVTRSNDPRFFASLDVLPNPDPILRKLGKTDQVYDAIGSDAHVMGEKRSIRSGLLRFEWRVAPGGDTPADMRAFELCDQYMQHRPAPSMRWADVLWNKAEAVFRGMRVHELSWQREGNEIMPSQILDKPNRRFIYNLDNELRYLTRDEPMKGLEADAFRFLLTRHMPSYDNPYGEAVYSSCFWPYTFKHDGFKFFVKFCQKYGFPWPIGKYPEGSGDKEIDALLQSLAKMIEDMVCAVPIGSEVDMLNQTVSGKVVHQPLIQMCNTELSKALTSQTLTTEIQGEGSRAIGEVHREKETAVNESDRDMIADSFNELFDWITLINVAGAQPPYFEFYDDAKAMGDWVKVIDTARNFVDIPQAFVYETLQIPEPKKGDKVVARGASPQSIPTPDDEEDDFAASPGGADFRIGSLADQAAARADELLQALPEAARTLLDEVDSLSEFESRLHEIYPGFDDSALVDMTALALQAGLLTGADEALDNGNA